MSAYEQHVEPPDRSWQYLLFAAEPYETISFKVNCFLSYYVSSLFVRFNCQACTLNYKKPALMYLSNCYVAIKTKCLELTFTCYFVNFLALQCNQH